MGNSDLCWITRVILLLLIGPAGASEIWTQGFVRVQWLSSLVVGNHLYLDGGEIVNETYGYTQGSTLQIDLTRYWSNSNVTAKYADKYQPYPYVRSPVLWSDGVYLYNYGGIPYFFDGCVETYSCTNPIYLGGAGHAIGATPLPKQLGPGGEVASNKSIEKNLDFPRDLYKLRISDFTQNHAWKKADQQPPASIHPMQSPAVVNTGDMVFALSGFSGIPYISRNYNPLYATKGLASWKTDATGWKNDSSRGYKPTGINALGQGVHVPFGEKGAMVFIGGYSPPSPLFSFADESTTPENLADMSLINIYDIATEKWYSQRAGGVIPASRFSFCAVSVSESGSNTAEIFIHGGYASTRNSEPYNNDLANIFMLSIPSFVWTSLPRSTQPLMRANPTCKVIGKRQMVVIGGVDPQDAKLGETPDPWVNGILLYDMSDWRWTPNYNPDAKPYVRNPRLVAQINQLAYPPLWSSPGVRQYFKKYAPQNPPSGGLATNLHTESPVSDFGPTEGGIVGGVLGLALIIGAYFVWRWRRRKAKHSSHSDIPVEERPRPLLAEAPFQNVKPSPSELPEQKKALELGPPQLWELGPPQLWELEQPLEREITSASAEEQDTPSSTADSEKTNVDDNIRLSDNRRYEMEG